MPYEIKPLVWKRRKLDCGSEYVADTVCGRYSSGHEPGLSTVVCGSNNYWMFGAFVFPCKSIADGKRQAEAHYRERVLECLVEVQP